MKEILEQLNQLIENYIKVQEMYRRYSMIACMEKIDDLKTVMDNIEQAISFVIKELLG